MLLPRFESIISILLKGSLHQICYHKVPSFLSEKDLFLNLHWISEMLIFYDFSSRLNSHLMVHDEVAVEGNHIGFEEAPKEHEGGLVNVAHDV